MGVIRYNFAQATKALRENREDITKLCIAPVVAIVVLTAIPANSSIVGWVTTTLAYGVYLILAVGIHRQILLTATENQPAKLENYGRFGVWGVFIALLWFLFFLPLMALNSSSFILFVCLLIPALYVTARISLVLPNRAVGGAVPLPQVWSWSDGHGWQLAGALFLPPFILNVLVGLGTFWISGLGRDIVLALFAVPIVVIEVAVLSVAYRDLKARYEAA